MTQAPTRPAEPSSSAGASPVGAPEQPQHEVLIIGAGLGGIGVAMQLERAGITDFVLFERRGDIGGTWDINHYPDVAADIPALAYQFSFELNPDWSRVFPKGAELKAYVKALVDKYQIAPRVQLGTEVVSRVWDEEAHLWRLTFASGKVVTGRYVVSAVGAFVDPKVPDITGLESFAGKVIQTQEWDDDYDLTGKKVAIIGTGATAVQVIPQVAKVAERLDVYQRRAIWALPKPDFPIPAPARWALRHVPGLQRVIREVVIAVFEVLLVGIVVLGKWVEPITRAIQLFARVFIFTQVRDKELRRKLTPGYGFGCKRPAISNIYYRAFNRSNVDLVTDPITRITPTGIETKDGRLREVDVLILATGFALSQDPELYKARPVRGRAGFDLADYYLNNPPTAYEGTSMLGLPNTFTVFGPFGWTGGSWHVLVENTGRHAVRVIQEAHRRGATSAEIAPAALAKFDAFIRPKSRGASMHRAACATANSYYIDQHGEFSLLRPTTSYQAVKASKTFPLDDYIYSSLTKS